MQRIIQDRESELRVTLRTRTELLLDTRVCQIEAEHLRGHFVVRAGGEPLLTALVPGELVLRKSDGSEVRVRIDWGSLTKVGRDVRLVVDHATILGEPVGMPIAV